MLKNAWSDSPSSDPNFLSLCLRRMSTYVLTLHKLTSQLPTNRPALIEAEENPQSFETINERNST